MVEEDGKFYPMMRVLPEDKAPNSKTPKDNPYQGTSPEAQQLLERESSPYTLEEAFGAYLLRKRIRCFIVTFCGKHASEQIS